MPRSPFFEMKMTREIVSLRSQGNYSKACHFEGAVIMRLRNTWVDPKRESPQGFLATLEMTDCDFIIARRTKSDAYTELRRSVAIPTIKVANPWRGEPVSHLTLPRSPLIVKSSQGDDFPESVELTRSLSLI